MCKLVEVLMSKCEECMLIPGICDRSIVVIVLLLGILDALNEVSSKLGLVRRSGLRQ